jgi:hypothetical protein
VNSADVDTVRENRQPSKRGRVQRGWMDLLPAQYSRVEKAAIREASTLYVVLFQ